MSDGFFGLVTHVREAEGLAFDFAVARVDDEVMFFAKVAGEFGNVDAATVPDARQGLRSISIFGEEIEAGAADPIVDERVGAGVAFITIRQAFGEDVVEL